MVNKNALRAGAVTAGTALTLLISSPAFAATPVDGMDPGPGLSVAETIGLYVVIPLALFAIIASCVVLTDKSRKKQS